MRSFSFDVLVRESAQGYVRITEGAYWYRLAKRLLRKDKVTLVQHSKTFAGYGGSYDVGYTRYKFTVTEMPGAFQA